MDMITFLATTIFALVHLFASYALKLGRSVQAHILSAGGGVAIAYVFVDLLPKLGESELLVKQAFIGFFPYFERHVYVMALVGFLLFFVVDKAKKSNSGFYLSLFSYSLFNFLVGYAISDKNDPDVQPLVLFTFAIALHYFINDYDLSEKHPRQYQLWSRWVLILFLYLGWILGQEIELSPTAVALVSAFIAGGVILNVTRHEISNQNLPSMLTFLLTAIFYTGLLLTIGQGGLFALKV